MRLGQLTEDNIEKMPALTTDRQTTVRSIMQGQLQGIDLTKREAVIPNALAASMKTLQGEIAEKLQHDDFSMGWTQAYSLDRESARQTADFLIYSSLSTVARRPGTTTSWTQTGPLNPLLETPPTTSTFHWRGSASVSRSSRSD